MKRTRKQMRCRTQSLSQAPTAQREGGFTLPEVLVGLMVLGFVASLVSASLSTAFTSTDRLQAITQSMHGDRKLHSVMDELADTLWLPNGPVEVNVIESLNLVSDRFDALDIRETDQSVFQLLAILHEENDQIIETPVYISENPLRLIARGHWDKARKSYDYQSLVLQGFDGEWMDIHRVYLKIDQDPACRFDIVARGCRS